MRTKTYKLNANDLVFLESVGMCTDIDEDNIPNWRMQDITIDATVNPQKQNTIRKTNPALEETLMSKIVPVENKLAIYVNIVETRHKQGLTTSVDFAYKMLEMIRDTTEYISKTQTGALEAELASMPVGVSTARVPLKKAEDLFRSISPEYYKTWTDSRKTR